MPTDPQLIKANEYIRHEKDHCVQPILGFTNAFVHGGKPIKGVRVMNKKYLVESLRSCSAMEEQESWLWEKRGEFEGF